MTTDFKNRSKTKWEGTGMGTEGNGAQESADTRAEYIPVWLPVEYWRILSGMLVASCGGEEEYIAVSTIRDAIDWAESR